MVQFKKIVVCIDLTEMDEALIHYAREFMKNLEAESLIFLHILHKSGSHSLFGKSKDASESISASSLRQEIKEKLSLILKGEVFDWSVDVQEGDINDKMLAAVSNHSADLLIMGRKQDISDSEGLPKKTVKKCGCSVLLVPEAPVKEFRNIVVPVDFSEYSAFAIKVASFISNQNSPIYCKHVYEVPSGYHRTGKDYYEFAKVMEKNAKNDTVDFIKKYKLPEEQLKFIYTLDEHGRPAKEVINCAKKIDSSLIIMGSKGRTGAASMLLGSVAEDMVTLNDLYPLLVIKKKNENLGFFDVILKM